LIGEYAECYHSRQPKVKGSKDRVSALGTYVRLKKAGTTPLWAADFAFTTATLRPRAFRLKTDFEPRPVLWRIFQESGSRACFRRTLPASLSIAL